MIQLFHMAKRTTALFEAQLYYQCPSPAICSGYSHFKEMDLRHLYARPSLLSKGGVWQIAYWLAPGQMKAWSRQQSGQKWRVLLIGFSHINNLRASETGLQHLVDSQANFSEFFSGFCGGYWLLFPSFYISVIFSQLCLLCQKKFLRNEPKNA